MQEKFLENSNYERGKGEESRDEEVKYKEETEYNEICKEIEWKWVVLPGKYIDIKLYDDGNFIGVQNKEEKYGFIDKDNNIIVDFKYKNILGINEKIARVLDFDNGYRFVNCDGNELNKESYVDAYDFSDGLAAVKKNEKWGFIDKNGVLIIDYEFEQITTGFHEEKAAVKSQNLWYFIDKQGKSVFEETYEEAKNFHEGCAGVKKHGKWGFIDETGKLVIDFIYDDIGNFSEGKAAVKRIVDNIEQWAYIDKGGDIVIDFKIYEASEGRKVSIGEFQNNYALVTDVLYCLIDTKGEQVLGLDSAFLVGGSSYNQQFSMIQAYQYTDDSMRNKKYGFIDLEGNCKIPFVFQYISNIRGNLVSVMLEENGEMGWGIISVNYRN